jgi:hypothetical protein
MLRLGCVPAMSETETRIHAAVPGPFGRAADKDFGSFGFDGGVTSVAVRVSHAYHEGGSDAVESAQQYSFRAKR